MKIEVPSEQNEKTETPCACHVAVIGGGPAGMMAAAAAADRGAKVILFEQNGRLGRKMGITGKGRCNITNNCTPEEFLKNVLRGKKFMYGPSFRFTPEDAMAFFENAGLELKTERGRRVFPASDRAADAVCAMERELSRRGVEVVYEKAVKIEYAQQDCCKSEISVNEISANEQCGCTTESRAEDENVPARVCGIRVCGVHTKEKMHSARAVIIATGGISYPATGSRGDGHKMARRAGLEVTELSGSLVPIQTEEKTAPLAGLTLKNVVLTASRGKKTVYSEMGEMLFSHFGITGPLVLSASANMQSGDISEYSINVDLKPAITSEELDRRLISMLCEGAGKDMINALNGLLPAKLTGYILSAAGIDHRAKAHSIDKITRKKLVNFLKALPFTPVSFRPVSEAIVTCGGVALSQISPKTMMAKDVPGLFFAGEVLDCDAYTGGYNLQIAYSTGYAAGNGAAEYAFAETL